MSKILYTAIIIGFWFFYPLGLMLMGEGNYDIYVQDTRDYANPTLLDYIGTAISLVGNYFQLLVIGIPDAPFIINRIVNFLQIISGLLIFVLLKE